MIKRPTYYSKIEPFVGKNIIKVLVGVRRSGKSTLLRQIEQKLRDSGVAEEAVISANFESATFDSIVDEESLKRFVRERICPGSKTYLFFDEIQEVSGWEKALRSFMVDYDVDIYVTGSNANLLSSDLATYITGRYVQIPVFPFSFREYVDALRECGLDDVASNSRLAFHRYVKQGGFPFQFELGFAEEPSLLYLRDVFSTVLFRDVVQRNGIRDADQLARILQYVMEQVGHSFSAKSVSDYLKSERRSVSLDTVYNYVHAAEGACLLYRAAREDAVGKKALKFNEKLYVVDHGLRQALGFSNEGAIDQVLENIVYMELLRRGYAVSVGKIGEREIDFVATKEGRIEYYQVAYLLADERTVEREFASLEAVPDNYPKTVLSLDEFQKEREGIRSLNLVDWLLGEA